jgi:uncharacterized protein (DUF427 family)
MKAVWNGTVVAESDDTVVVEGNHYFPRNSVREELLAPSDTTTVCPWKGTASYYTLPVTTPSRRARTRTPTPSGTTPTPNRRPPRSAAALRSGKA